MSTSYIFWVFKSCFFQENIQSTIALKIFHFVNGREGRGMHFSSLEYKENSSHLQLENRPGLRSQHSFNNANYDLRDRNGELGGGGEEPKGSLCRLSSTTNMVSKFIRIEIELTVA